MSPFRQFRPTFTDLRSEIERRAAHGADPAELRALVDQFVEVLGDGAIPLVSFDGTVTWIYRDAQARTVSVVGDIIGFEPAQTRMQRVAGTDMFWFTTVLPQNAHISYAFAVDLPDTADSVSRQDWLAHCRPDPFNRRRLIDIRPLREMSVLSLGGTEQGAHDIVDEPAELAATVVPALPYVVAGPGPAEWRRVWVVPPLEYAPNAQRYPVVVFLDGERYMLAGEAAQTMCSLQENQEIAPALQVFVEAQGSVDEQELFLTERLPSWICECFAAEADPTAWVLAGASASAAVALQVALRTPDVYGGVIAQSPVPVMPVDELRELLGETRPRCYIDVGRHEPPAMTEYSHALSTALIEAGAALAYQEFPGGHSFAGWRATLPDALRFHLSVSPLSDI